MKNLTLQAALNGDRDHPATPRTPQEIASEAWAAVEAGARSLHLHPYDETGGETLDAEACAVTLRAVRAACPGVEISLSTSSAIEPDPERLHALVADWVELPDLVTANQGQEGVIALCELLVDRGVGIEAGLLSLDDARLFVEAGLASVCVRAMVEPLDPDPDDATEHAEAVERVLEEAGITLEQVHHGDGIASWAVNRRALERGHGIRTGLEDTPVLPDGSLAAGNGELVATAAALMRSRRALSRTARLLEMLVRVQTKPRFTASELAEEFEVSRRTIIRDLAVLTDMGVPLRSTPGPGGGYSLPRGGRRLSPSLTVDEAVALIVSYEALLRYADSPFGPENLSAVTKLRAALPSETVGELDDLRRHIAVLDPVREYEAPLLGELLGAAVDESHLRVVYDSVSGVSEREIFPYGLFASRGFWYCACHDYRRGKRVSLRADRFQSVRRTDREDRPPHVSPDEWASGADDWSGEAVELRLRVSERCVKSFDFTTLFGATKPDPDGLVSVEVPRLALDHYAVRLLGFGDEVSVESPSELVEAMREEISALSRLYFS